MDSIMETIFVYFFCEVGAFWLDLPLKWSDFRVMGLVRVRVKFRLRG